MEESEPGCRVEELFGLSGGAKHSTLLPASPKNCAAFLEKCHVSRKTYSNAVTLTIIRHIADGIVETA